MHPLQTLWRRNDWLASAELFSIGWALANQRDATLKEWFRDAARKVKSSSNAGLYFELFAAAMLNNDHQRACLAPPSAPGYDILMTLPSQAVVRISCKVLEPSQHESQFVEAARNAANVMKEYVVNRRVSMQFIALANSHDQLSINSLEEYLSHYLNGPLTPKSLSIPGWTVIATPLASDVSGTRISRLKESYNIVIATPYHSSEQKRFEDLFRRAAHNLRRHYPSVSEQATNMIMIKLPDSVSIRTAAEWLKSKFAADYSTITAVMFYRCSLRKDEQGVTFIGQELFLMNNPHAKVPWDKISSGIDQMHLMAPIGNLLTGDPVVKIIVGDVTLASGSLYMYHEGVMHYEIDFPFAPQTSISLKMQPSPNVHSVLVLRDVNTGEVGFIQRDRNYLAWPKLALL